MMFEPLSVSSLREAYLAKEMSPTDVARESLRRIAAYSDPAVWISRASEDAVMARARELETMRDRMDDLALYGIPFAVKDNIDAAGLPTTAACAEFAYTPGENSVAVARLIAAGAILLGKTNLDQFATGLVGTRSPYGAPRSVFDARYVSGGSSSGSAVAVAAGLVAFSLGTDTAGSGRVPAAFNAIVGLKPSRGLISARGVVPACRTLDCVSIFAQSVRDASDVLNVAQGFDAKDPYSRVAPARGFTEPGLRVGVLAPEDREFFGDESSACLYDKAIDKVSSLGAEIVEIDYAPFRNAGNLLYAGPWTGERYAAISGFIERHESAMDASVRTIIASARNLSAADAFNGLYRLAEYRRAAEREWSRVDVLLLPTAPTQDTVEDVNADPIARNSRLGLYTNFVNLLDCCAIAIPAGFRGNGLPFGVTLIAPAFYDGALASVAARILGEKESPSETVGDMIPVFVVGAHLSGLPLNAELKAIGAKFVREARTEARYRFYVLPGTHPPKPGLVRVPSGGESILGEVWAIPAAAFGPFAAAIPSPLGIGKIALADGTSVSGFLCEHAATEGVRDITSFGGWRRYVES